MMLALFSEESMKAFRDEPDNWRNKLTWIEKSQVKNIITQAGDVASGNLGKRWSALTPENMSKLKVKD